MAKQGMLNQMVVLALAQDSVPAILESLCVFANKFPNEQWVDWLDRSAADAEARLDKIDKKRKQEKANGAVKRDIDELVRYMKDSAKLSKPLRDELSKALGEYRLKRTVSFNASSNKLTEINSHPASAPTAQLIAFSLCVASRDGHWQEFRRCQEPKCREFFLDHMTRGRPSQRYCCKRHRNAHNKRIQRGGK